MQKENWKNAVVIPWKNFFAAAMQDIFGRQLKSVIRNTASNIPSDEYGGQQKEAG